MIIVTGIKLTISLDFIQFNFIKMFKCLKKGNRLLSNLFLTLGGRIGVGSIAGIALAIYLGGPGTVFWIWIISFLGAANTFGETILGLKYHEKDEEFYRGGPPYYIKKGLKNKHLSLIYAIMILISYVGGFIGIQANTIVKAINGVNHISPIMLGIILTVIVLIIIWGGIEKITRTTDKLVPFMLIAYLLCGLFVIIGNINSMPQILKTIIISAFNFDSLLKGFIPALLIGIQRGIFASEAGLGTGSIASSVSDYKNPVINGYVQMLGVYITTLLVCTVTAIMILSFDYENVNLADVNGIEITIKAFYHHFGNLGHFIMLLFVLLFSFSTILTSYYYGESCLKFIIKPNKTMIKLLKMVCVLVLLIGSITTSKILWTVIDLQVGLLAIINVYALSKLNLEIKTTFIDYQRKKC